MCAANCHENGLEGTANVCVLDWMHPPDDWAAWWTARTGAGLAALTSILVADCVFEEHLSEAWMRCACALLVAQRDELGGGVADSACARLLVAVERRPAFLTASQRVQARAYDAWRALFSADERPAGDGPDSPRPKPLHPATLPLVGVQLNLSNVPQSVLSYERTPELQVWQLRLQTSGPAWARYRRLLTQMT